MAEGLWGFFLSSTDTSMNSCAPEQSQHLLHQDDLTPLLNYHGCRRACCAMIDLDDFKAINDRHGHPDGDAALVHLRRRATPASAPRRHHRAAGGDEFALILVNCSGGNACLLKRLQKAASPLPIPDGAAPMRFSAGAVELHAVLLNAKRQGKDDFRPWQSIA